MDKLPVHSIFAYCGKLYKVMTADGCQSCSFKDNKKLCEDINDICPCTKVNRDDNKGIVYMELMHDLSDISLNAYKSINDARVEVVPNEGCAGCAFIEFCGNTKRPYNRHTAEISNYFGACSSINREDGISVIFKIVGPNPFITLCQAKDKEIKDDTTTSFTGRDASGVSEANASHTTQSDDYNANIIKPTVKGDTCDDIHISIPDGFAIDVEASDLTIGHIVFKPLYIDYSDILYKLYESHNIDDVTTYYDDNIHKLDNIVKYYNGDEYTRKQLYKDTNKGKYVIGYNHTQDEYFVDSNFELDYGNPSFINEEDARAVINNPKLRSILDAIFKH